MRARTIPSSLRKACGRNERAERGRFDEDGKNARRSPRVLLSCNEWPRRFSGTTRFCLLAYSRLVASAAGTVRPDDHPAIRRYDAFLHEGTVGAIGIVCVTAVCVTAVCVTAPTIVAIPRPDAEAERADLHASPSRVRAHIDLSGGRNRRNEQGAGCHGQ